jgi:diguanylate cyclase (GGDEF)-like protein
VEARTKYAASFVSIYARDLLDLEQGAARNWFAGPRVGDATLQHAAGTLGLNAAMLLDAHGHAIATLPSGEAEIDAALLRRYPSVGASTGANISLTPVGTRSVVSFAIAYPTAAGTRVFTGAYEMTRTVLPTVLGRVLSTPGWRAELVDAHGGRLVASSASRSRGEQVSFSATVAGTSWRLIVHDPTAQLYSFLNGAGRWLAWLALAGLAAAGLAVIGLFARLQRRRAQLTALNRELARLAAVDPLTGLRNRRAIEQYLHDALSAARRHGLDLSLLVVDVDHFKHFNDTLGHRSGDAVLAHAARVLDGALRAEDAIGRWGGEEFLIVLPGTDEQGALHATERLRAALAADQPEEGRARGLPVTVTIGLAEWHDETVEELVSRADGALYRGKHAGRDTVQIAPGVPRSLETSTEAA